MFQVRLHTGFTEKALRGKKNETEQNQEVNNKH